MIKKYMKSTSALCALIVSLALSLAQSALAADSYNISFSTGVKVSVPAGSDFVFAITCQPPTDITKIEASAGTLTAQQTVAGGPSTPQGTIKGLWTLSNIKSDVNIMLTLNTQDGADLPEIITDKAAAEAAMSDAGGGMGPPPGEGGQPPAGPPPGAAPQN